MEPKSNPEAAARAEEIMEELHQICKDNGWPIACLFLVEAEDNNLKVLGSVQVDFCSQLPMLMSTGRTGMAILDMARICNWADEDPKITAEGLKRVLEVLASGLSTPESEEAKR